MDFSPGLAVRAAKYIIPEYSQKERGHRVLLFVLSALGKLPAPMSCNFCNFSSFYVLTNVVATMQQSAESKKV